MICKNCGNEFKIHVEIDGVQHNLCNRKYCLTCSPFNLHNTKIISPIENKQSRTYECQRCHKIFVYCRCKGMTTKYCCGCKTTIARQKRKIKMMEYKGNKCEKCGYSECQDVLCFHHKNSITKEVSLSKIRSWKKTKIELDKCELLCANCHMEEHARLEKSDKILQLVATIGIKPMI